MGGGGGLSKRGRGTSSNAEGPKTEKARKSTVEIKAGTMNLEA